MTTKKLLTGVALAALVAGVATAQDATLDAGGDLNGQTIAPEIDTALSGNIIIDFEFVDPGVDATLGTADDIIHFAGFGAGGVAEIEINLTNATLNGVFGGTITTGDANCDFGAPSLGGGSGQASITYDSDGTIQDCGDNAGVENPNTGTLTIPVNVTDNNSDVTVSVAFRGDGTDDGTFVDSTDMLTALDVGTQTVTFSTAAGLAGSGLFNETGTTLSGTGLIATLSIADLEDNDVDLAATTITDPSQLIDDIDVTLTFPAGTTGLGTPLLVNAAGSACAAPTANSSVCTIVAADLDAMVDAAGDSLGVPIMFDIVADGNAATSVLEQTPTIEVAVNSAANFDASASDLGASDTADIELDDGLTETPVADYDWVRFGSGGTESNFRIQFASAAVASTITQIRVEVGSEGNGIAAGTYVLTAGDADTGFQVKGGTVTFNSRALGAAAGATGNADISVEFQTADADAAAAAAFTDLRQMVNRSPSSYVATPGLINDTP